MALPAAPGGLDGGTELKAVLEAQQEPRTGMDHLGHWAPDPAITRVCVNQSWVLVPTLSLLAALAQCSSHSSKTSVRFQVLGSAGRAPFSYTKS